MINLEEILILKHTSQVEIIFNGIKFYTDKQEILNKSEEEIKIWYLNEVLGMEVGF